MVHSVGPGHWLYLVKGDEWPGTKEVRVNRDICNAAASDGCPTTLELDAGRVNSHEAEPLHVPHTPAQELRCELWLRRAAREES